MQAFGRGLDPEVEAMVPALAKKAGEMSTAGRETFLAQEASVTLACMVDLLSIGRVTPASPLFPVALTAWHASGGCDAWPCWYAAAVVWYDVLARLGPKHLWNL